jgi:Leucine-rich repeat (LRR) protein
VLSLPLKITHPGIVDGTLKSETLERLKKFDLKNNNISKTDPRWDKLKDLI